jgi:GMP synthase (glutamine-hydrolysing)
MTQPRALLVSFRDATDPMAEQERECFAERSRLPVANVDLCLASKHLPSAHEIRKYDAVFFGGSGSYSVLDDIGWIQQGLRLCLTVAELKVPGYASCFGFQGLARALGGEVIHDDARTELGATPLSLTPEGLSDGLFQHLPAEFRAQEGHHDHVNRLPPGVTLLATGSVSQYQAFRVHGAPFWASQFHPELTAATTSARFRHYMALYDSGDPQKAAATLEYLETGVDSPEVRDLLVRLVRHEF